VQRVPLSLTSTAGASSVQAAGALSNINLVQLSAPSTTIATGALHIPRGSLPAGTPHQFTHMPRGRAFYSRGVIYTGLVTSEKLFKFMNFSLEFALTFKGFLIFQLGNFLITVPKHDWLPLYM